MSETTTVSPYGTLGYQYEQLDAGKLVRMHPKGREAGTDSMGLTIAERLTQILPDMVKRIFDRYNPAVGDITVRIELTPWPGSSPVGRVQKEIREEALSGDD